VEFEIAKVVDFRGLPASLDLSNNPDGADPFAQALLERLKNRNRDVCVRDVSLYLVEEVRRVPQAAGYNQLPLEFSQGANFVIVAKE